MEDLGQFSPSVEIAENLHDWSVTIRGMGNDVAALAVEQSAPIFIDGIHMGRPSMIKGAFMDLERIEVLTGPQPIYFGQNATAGAFSLTTRGPTPEWEGDATAEFGNFGRITFKGGVGGPLSDTIGIRIAGLWDDTGGHLTDVYSGNKFPNRTDSATRVKLAWNPTDNYEGTLKFEYVRRRSDGDTNTNCLSPVLDDGSDPLFNRLEHNNFTIMIPGEIPEFTDEIVPLPNCVDGFSRIGVQEGDGQFPAPIHGINNDDGRAGLLDIRDIAREIMPDGNLTGREPLDAIHLRLGGRYELSNGIAIEGTYGFVDYDRETFEASDESPYLMEAAFRNEDFIMHSGEIRVTSPTGGQIEWMGGIYHQTEKLDMDPVRTLRATTRQAMRRHHPYQDSEWISAFAGLTFNFFDDSASLDIGGRYSDVSKQGGITAEYHTWIFDVDPDTDSVPGDGFIDSTEHRRGGDHGGDRVRDAADFILSCETLTLMGTGEIASGVYENFAGRNVGADVCGEYAGQAGFWTHLYETVDTPDAWDTLSPIDISPQGVYGLDDTGDNGPFQDTHSSDSFDPQVVLRYRPTNNHSLYAKWARAFKAGGFDTSDRGISRGGLRFPIITGDTVSFNEDGQKEFEYLKEEAEVWEVGSKGNLMNGRIRYGGTLFRQTIKNLQVETEIADFDAVLAGAPATGRFLTNAGVQRNQGFEFNFGFAATDRLTTNLTGVIQRSRMVEFIGGCTETETIFADTGPCISRDESFELTGNSRAIDGNIDRSGEKAPRAPNWKFILTADYELPLFDRFIGRINSKMAVSDEYSEDTLGFTYIVQWPVHADWNTTISIGDVDGTWDVGFYARNILSAQQEYKLENDDEFSGIQSVDMAQSAWFNYGIQFNYHFR
jgi:outer membrane receptor protein involved in Fe transport